MPPQQGLQEQELHTVRNSGLLERLRNEWQERSTARNWVDKDPRLAITLPVWDQVLLRQVPVMVCIRSPQDVAASLRLREGIPFELGIILWRYYNQNLRHHCQERDTLVLDYELDLRQNPSGTAQKMINFAQQCGYTVDDWQIESAAAVFQPSFQRNRAAQQQQRAHATPGERTSRRLQHALESYTLIRSLPLGQWPESLEPSTQMREEDEQWMMLYRKTRCYQQPG